MTNVHDSVLFPASFCGPDHADVQEVSRRHRQSGHSGLQHERPILVEAAHPHTEAN